MNLFKELDGMKRCHRHLALAIFTMITSFLFCMFWALNDDMEWGLNAVAGFFAFKGLIALVISVISLVNYFETVKKEKYY